MTLTEAIATQPLWVQIWLNVLFAGAFVLPLALLIWAPSRRAGILTVLASILAGAGIFWLYAQLGYVRLLGLPHILIWTPLVVFLWGQSNRPNMPRAPRLILYTVMAVILVSLAFDYVDLARYILGDRAAY
jgi:hypothetical protein